MKKLRHRESKELAKCHMAQKRHKLKKTNKNTTILHKFTKYQTWYFTLLLLYSVTQSCPTLHNPMDCSMPSLSAPHHLPKVTQIHVYCISDAIQPSHPLLPSSPSPQYFPASRSFPVSQLSASGDQSIRASASESILLISI